MRFSFAVLLSLAAFAVAKDSSDENKKGSVETPTHSGNSPEATGKPHNNEGKKTSAHPQPTGKPKDNPNHATPTGKHSSASHKPGSPTATGSNSKPTSKTPSSDGPRAQNLGGLSGVGSVVTVAGLGVAFAVFM